MNMDKKEDLKFLQFATMIKYIKAALHYRIN